MPDDFAYSSGQQRTWRDRAPGHVPHTPAGPPVPGSEHPAGAPGPDRPLRIVIADDNPVVRAGLAALLHGRHDIEVAAEAADGREAYEAAVRHRPDVILLDVRMPGVDGMAALPHLVVLAPVMMLTYSRESEIVREALRLGAGGYLVHGEFTADELTAAVRAMREGRPVFTTTAANALLAHLREQPDPRPAISAQSLSQLQSVVAQSSTAQRAASMRNREDFRLSSREAEVMELIAAGMSNQQIAATCFISEKTVKNHINRIFAKLRSTTRSEAIARWLGVSHA
ncbi:response regulator [Streptomyces sp. NPDC001691]|uniref:response regulator n=1 Tax=unclassified Streptomyces TaxID=2593676 RepID=UPI000DEB11E0|nr:response regulator transcription factor [Streptomyces sp. SDr-06]RCH67940.1 DNA-binding response regulator [Streptomyces sp. SDr-06]